MILFKSRTRIRAEKLRSDLLYKRAEIAIELNKTNRSLNPEAYSKLWVKSEDLREDINLINKILEK